MHSALFPSAALLFPTHLNYWNHGYENEGFDGIVLGIWAATC